MVPAIAERAVGTEHTGARSDGLDERSWEARVAAVAACAGEHALRVDAEACFPAEAVEAMRAEGLLGAWIDPLARRAGRVDRADRVGVRRDRAAVRLVRHGVRDAPDPGRRAHEARRRIPTGGRLALREIAATQRLIASATSEVGVGGDLRSSKCALQMDGAVGTLTKHAPVISYGLEADDILVTARRAEDAPPGDQQLVLLRRTEYALEQTSRWEALGMRGTCSHGFTLKARFPAEAVVPEPFARDRDRDDGAGVASALGVGLARRRDGRRASRPHRRARRRAPHRARAAGIRDSLTSSPGCTPSVASCTTSCASSPARMDDPDALGTMGYAIRVNNLKVNASEALVDIVQGAMVVAGIAGYRTDTPVTARRNLRDALGALVMINNDRIVAANASLLLASRED